MPPGVVKNFSDTVVLGSPPRMMIRNLGPVTLNGSCDDRADSVVGMVGLVRGGHKSPKKCVRN